MYRNRRKGFVKRKRDQVYLLSDFKGLWMTMDDFEKLGEGVDAVAGGSEPLIRVLTKRLVPRVRHALSL